ncbi:MAG: hypothetical protein JJE25_10350 [Bacteroidia bacterium]|nr:hypothetical protein [Bacteroidia bacterium]
MISFSKNRTLSFLLLLFLFLPSEKLFAEDEKTATIKIMFSPTDTTKTCSAVVMSDNQPVEGIELHFYVKRMFSLLPIGKTKETDENGVASVNFQNDIPGDKSGNIIAVVKIEDDETYGTVETKAEIKWGIIPSSENDSWGNRSLSASREKAPMYLIIVSNIIIAIIWGTIFYVIFQIFRIRKASKLLNKSNTINNPIL